MPKEKKRRRPGARVQPPAGMLYARNWPSLPKEMEEEFKDWGYNLYVDSCESEPPLPIERVVITVQLTSMGVNVRVWSKEGISPSHERMLKKILSREER